MALVYGSQMAAECRLLSFVIVILTISLFCTELCINIVCEVGVSKFLMGQH